MTKVTVVGAGVMGCAAAWALTERGADVTVLEQFELGHARGSSHGRTRIVRVAYPEPGWVRLAEEAMRGWRELEAQSGQALLGLYGLVEIASSPELTSAAALDACGLGYRLLDGEEARRLGVALPEGWAALQQPDAGVVRADLARRAFLDVALSRGARVETGRHVESADEVDADVVIVAAGAWVTTFVPDIPVSVTRETIAYFRREGPPPPSVVELNEETRGHAMYALHDPVHGLKAGAHHAGRETDPSEDGEPDAAIVERISAWVRERLPDADPEPAGAETCIYTNTADESFVLERRGRVVVGSACSGHGFKFAPAVGRRLAALALD
jgi:monomeric sarcosine oxidase